MSTAVWRWGHKIPSFALLWTRHETSVIEATPLPKKRRTRDHSQPPYNGRRKEGVSRGPEGGHRRRPQLRHTVGGMSRDTKGDHRHPQQGERGVSGGTEEDQYHHPRQMNPWKLKQLRYQRHISNLVRKSCQTEAVQLLEQMKRSKVRPDVVVYNTILSGYGKQGDVNSAFKTFNEMKKRALPPTDHTYSSMYAACGGAGEAGGPILDKVRAEMERRDVRPNTIVSNSLMAALALCGRHQEAMQVYLQMSSTYTEPDLCTFGALLLAVGKDRTQGLGVAMRVWSEMAASALTPDLYIYNMLLQVLRDAGLEGVATGCVAGEPSRRPVPSVPIAMLQGKMGVASKAAGDVGVPMEGVKEWIADDEDSENYLFVKKKIEFKINESHMLVLHVGGASPDATPTTRWLEKRSVEDLFAAMKLSGVKPDIHTFQLLVHLTLDPAHLLVTMRERGVELDSKFMGAAITQQAKHLNNLQGAKILLQYSRNVGLDLGQVGYQAVATSCVERTDGIQLLKKMMNDHVQPNHFVLGTLIGHAVRDHNYEYLTSLIKAMMHFGSSPNTTILQMLDTAASRKVKSSNQLKRQNGFKGFYAIWKNRVCPTKPTQLYTL